MPPKKRVVETRGEEEVEREGVETELIPGSPASSASYASSSSCPSVTTVQLEKILEANHRSMTALLASMSTSSSAGSSRASHIKIPKWSDEEIPFEYFVKFEKAVKHNKIEKGAWGQLLPVYLAGRAQAALAQVDADELDDYDAVKATLLESLGDTPASADRKWWSLNRMSGEEPGSFYLRVRAIGLRRLYGLSTREEITEKIILSRFLSLLPADCYSSVVTKQPQTGLEAARLVQEYEETRAFSRRRQPWKQDFNHHSQQSFHRREQGGSSGTSGSGGVSIPKDGTSDQNPNAGAPQSKGGKYVKSERQGRKPITCYGCGEVGHIRPNCPNKVRRVSSSDSESRMEVDGWLAGVAVKGLKVDTGADRSVISAEYVPKNAYLDKSVILDSWRGKQFSKHRLARLSLKVADTEVEAVFAVADKLDCPALLGKDLGSKMTVQLLSLVLDAAKADQSENVNIVVTMQEEVKQEVAPVRVTRAQKEREELEDQVNDIASAQSESDPLPLSEIYGFEDGFFDEDPLPTPIEECEVLPGIGVVDVPLPTLVNSDSDCLVEEQQADATLKTLCTLASKLEKGYSFQDGILVHTTSDGLGDSLVRILVPSKRRLSVLELAHTHMLAGHFGFKKTFGRVSAKFLWPKMWVDVKNYVRTCAGCQKASRKDRARAPLQPLQCESEPFSKVAFDLVGGI